MNRQQHQGHRCRHGRPSSFGMQNTDLVFAELGLKPGDAFLDIGCGAGDYSIRAAALVGTDGVVYALDKSPNLVHELQARAIAEHVPNITAIVADATTALPIRDKSIDVCLVATVLHIPEVSRNADRLFSEIHRVLKPHGYVTIIECGNKDTSHGPPLEMRLSPGQIEAMASPHGFRRLNETGLGFNYMITVSPTVAG